MKPLKAFLIICFFLNSPLISQNNTLKGKMLFLSSGKTPAQGVAISGSIMEIENTNSVYTTDDGSYVLIFPKAREGHRVDLAIGEADQHGKQIEVVNEKEVEICRISADYKEEFEIIVCPKGSRDLAAQKYYRIIKTSSDLALANIKKEMDELLTQQEKDYNLIAEYGEKIAKLEKQTDSLTIYREAFQIASINRDNASKRVLRYLQLLDEGKSIMEAREALSIKNAAFDLNQSMQLFKAATVELETRAGASSSIFDYEDAIICYDTILSYAERMNIDPLMIAQYYSNSSEIIQSNGKYAKALKYEEKALAIRHEILNSNHSDLAQSYHSISSVYVSLGEYDRALEYAEKAIEIGEEIFDPNHPDLAIFYNNIGTVYDPLGEYDKALEYYQKVLDIRKEIFHPNHPSLGISYNNIGTVYESIGKYDKALEYLQKALEIQEEILDPNHPNLAGNYFNICNIYTSLGEYNKALEYAKKGLEIGEEIFHPNHPYLAISYNNIGQTYNVMGEHYKALEYAKKALEIQEEILGLNHPNLATYYNNIGKVHESLGEYDKALEYAKKALEIFEEIFDPNHPNIATLYTNIGTTYGNIGEYDKALEYQRKALIIFEEIMDPNHPILPKFYNLICSTYRSLGEYIKALEYEQKALEIRKEILDPNHPDLAASYNNIGLTHAKLNQFKEAHEAFTTYEKRFPEAGRSFRNWAMYYALKGDKEKALLNLKKAIELGYNDLNWLETDDSMDSLRNEEEFKAIIASLKKQKE
ncbi:MAG: tetratricopeptide repeat protein [Saprospiraceae bacterium]|nr:tetratricopeptide repeat protein [Saprospiraceae bacterium]